MSETSPKYRTGDSGDEQPEDWGGTWLPVPRYLYRDDDGEDGPDPDAPAARPTSLSGTWAPEADALVRHVMDQPTPLTDAELEATAEHVRMARAGSESAARLIINHDVPMLLAEVRRLQWENAALYTEMDAWRGTVARLWGVPYTPEGKRR